VTVPKQRAVAGCFVPSSWKGSEPLSHRALSKPQVSPDLPILLLSQSQPLWSYGSQVSQTTGRAVKRGKAQSENNFGFQTAGWSTSNYRWKPGTHT